MNRNIDNLVEPSSDKGSAGHVRRSYRDYIAPTNFDPEQIEKSEKAKKEHDARQSYVKLSRARAWLNKYYKPEFSAVSESVKFKIGSEGAPVDNEGKYVNLVTGESSPYPLFVAIEGVNYQHLSSDTDKITYFNKKSGKKVVPKTKVKELSIIEYKTEAEQKKISAAINK